MQIDLKLGFSRISGFVLLSLASVIIGCSENDFEFKLENIALEDTVGFPFQSLTVYFSNDQLINYDIFLER